MAFDPNDVAGVHSGIFGLPNQPEDEKNATLVYLPVPWEATTSYGKGTSKAPAAILEASRQIDLFDSDVLKPYEAGLFLLPEAAEIHQWNHRAQGSARKVIDHLSFGDASLDPSGESVEEALETVNDLGARLNQYVYQETRRLLDQGKFVGILGGDHSVPFGAFQAVAEKVPSFGILHFDAHFDFRKAYEGFTWSHASIMYNTLEHIPQVSKLVQVGIRDFGEQEFLYATEIKKDRVAAFLDRDLSYRKMEGVTWKTLTSEILSHLPQEVWISFDIDGLDPRFCPHTGTPVPGGLNLHEVYYLISSLVRSGRKIIGFDLNEVAPDLTDKSNEWDANVGARILYKLSAWLLASQGKAELRAY